jgi:hypothetical protein
VLTTRVGRAALGFAVLGVASPLGGCGATEPDLQEGTRPTPVATASLDHCPSRSSQLPRFDDHGWLIGSGRLPDGFRPVRVVRCRWDPVESSRPEVEDEDEVVIGEDHAPTVTPAFLAALDLPDQTFAPGSHMACAAIATSLSILVLVDAKGHAVVPHLPADPCGNPRDEVVRAENELGLTLHKTYRFEAAR